MRSRGLLVAGALACACGKTHDPAPAAGSAAASGSVPDAAAIAIDAAPAAAAETSPAVTFAAAADHAVVVYRTGPNGVTQLHSAPTDTLDYDSDLVWTTPDALFVRIGTTVSAVQGDQLVPVPLPPPKTWAVKPGKGLVHFDQIEAKLIATASGELWLGRCEWGRQNEEEHSCDEWAYARIAPSPLAVQRTEPAGADFAPPAVAPPASVVATLELEQVVDAGVDEYARPPQKILRCTRGDKTIQFPAADDRAGGNFVGMDEPVWLSADPPVFAITRNDFGLGDSYPTTLVFEGCTNTATGVTIEYGPLDVVAIVADQRATVRWHGRVLGTLDASRIAFAPSR